MGVLKDKLKRLLESYIEQLNIGKIKNEKNSFTVSFLDEILDTCNEELEDIKRSEQKNKKKK
jgi:hypothetical protein